MLYFIDTEFVERPGVLKLISIGIVAEDGREFYAVSSDIEPEEFELPRNLWVAENVVPHLWATVKSLGGHVAPNYEIACSIRRFVGTDPGPKFVGYYADFDWVLFCWLFGGMMELPAGWPQYCVDLKQEIDRLGLKIEQEDSVHNALLDARWIAKTYRLITLNRLHQAMRRKEPNHDATF